MKLFPGVSRRNCKQSIEDAIASESTQNMAKASARKRYMPRKADVKPSSISASAKLQKKSGFTIYIDDDDTPPPETKQSTPPKKAKPLRARAIMEDPAIMRT